MESGAGRFQWPDNPTADTVQQQPYGRCHLLHFLIWISLLHFIVLMVALVGSLHLLNVHMDATLVYGMWHSPTSM
jgi:hypothetical protein